MVSVPNLTGADLVGELERAALEATRGGWSAARSVIVAAVGRRSIGRFARSRQVHRLRLTIVDGIEEKRERPV